MRKSEENLVFIRKKNQEGQKKHENDKFVYFVWFVVKILPFITFNFSFVSR